MELQHQAEPPAENTPANPPTNNPATPPTDHPRLIKPLKNHECGHPNRSRSVFVMPSISFLSNRVSVRGSDTVTRNKLCLHKEMRQRYFGVTIPARWSPCLRKRCSSNKSKNFLPVPPSTGRRLS